MTAQSYSFMLYRYLWWFQPASLRSRGTERPLPYIYIIHYIVSSVIAYFVPLRVKSKIQLTHEMI